MGIHPEYLKFLEQVEELERKIKDLPEMSLGDVQHFPLTLTRPICMLKELLKWSNPENWRWLINNEHIAEEKRLLQKDLGILEAELVRAERTGEKVKIER